MVSDIDPAALGEAIRSEREQRGWTVYRLAQRSGMSDPYLRDIENGKSKRIGVAVIVRLAHALGVPTDDLLRQAGLGPATLDGEQVVTVYGLDGPSRRALLRIGHVLREMQAEYRFDPEDSETAEDVPLAPAAYDDSAGARAERDELDDMEPK